MQQLALHLLSHQHRWSTQERMDAVSTFIMMLDQEIELVDAWYEGVRADRIHVDSKLVADVYFSCPNELKIAIIYSQAFRHAEPATFKRIFNDAWQRVPMRTQDRGMLAHALQGFLFTNPKRASEYMDAILLAAWHPREELHLYGVDMLRFVNHLAPEDMARLKRRLQSRGQVRLSALNAVAGMLRRYAELSPELLAFCTSEEVNAIARRIAKSDPDRAARTCAYYTLMARIRYDEATGAGPFKARPRPKRPPR